MRNFGLRAALGCVHDVQGLNTETPVPRKRQWSALNVSNMYINIAHVYIMVVSSFIRKGVFSWLLLGVDHTSTFSWMP
jgi:hypothetical protein